YPHLGCIFELHFEIKHMRVVYIFN
ncbi:hypothetical protein, partial [Plasmodium yoelii yoelii]